jgi:hypothetical protein
MKLNEFIGIYYSVELPSFSKMSTIYEIHWILLETIGNLELSLDPLG